MLLNLLGSLSLTSDTGRVPAAAQQRKRLELLAILGVAGQQGISRERVLSFLWPESAGDRARHALDQLIYAVRRSLELDPILAEGRDIKLDPSVISTDLGSFDSAISDERWADAVSLYRGPLLDGFHLSNSRDLENWIDGERTRIDREYQSALEKLARRASSAGDTPGAIQWWKKLSASDPLSSRIAIEAITALAVAGERPAAILHARSYQQLVRSELEIDPDPRIEQLVMELGRSSGTQEARPVEPPARIPLVDDEVSPIAAYRRREFRWAVSAVAVILVAIGTLVALLRDESATDRGQTRPVNPEAQQYYLRGLNSWAARSKEGLDTAVVYFRRSLEIDPAYPEGYAGLANAYVLLGYSGYRPAEAMFPKARASALRAIELDSTLSAPYAALGLELTWEREFDDAEAAYRKAITLDPNYATAHQWYGMLHKILGRMDEAVSETRRAAELDPLSLQIQNTYATFLSASGQPAAALAHYRKMVGEEPDSVWVRRNPWLLTNMAGVYAANGMFDEALSAARRSVAITPRHPRSLTALAGVYISMGRPDIARQIFARVDTTNEHYAAQRAFFYADLNQLDSSFLYFDRVRRWPIPILISLGGNSKLAGDPRYISLLNRLGMSASPLR